MMKWTEKVSDSFMIFFKKFLFMLESLDSKGN